MNNPKPIQVGEVNHLEIIHKVYVLVEKETNKVREIEGNTGKVLYEFRYIDYSQALSRYGAEIASKISEILDSDKMIDSEVGIDD